MHPLLPQLPPSPCPLPPWGKPTADEILILVYWGTLVTHRAPAKPYFSSSSCLWYSSNSSRAMPLGRAAAFSSLGAPLGDSSLPPWKLFRAAVKKEAMVGGGGSSCPKLPTRSQCLQGQWDQPRGTEDQAWIKALGGEATARVERPSLRCTQGSLQGTVAVQGDSRCCHIRVMGRWKESSNCSTHWVRLKYHPLHGSQIEQHPWGWGKSSGELHAVGTQNHTHRGTGGSGG